MSFWNLLAAKKVNLTDVGIVGDLSDGSDVWEKGNQTSFYRGQAMGIGFGLGKSGFASQPTGGVGGDDFFSSLGTPQSQYGGFKKWHNALYILFLSYNLCFHLISPSLFSRFKSWEDWNACYNIRTFCLWHGGICRTP